MKARIFGAVLVLAVLGALYFLTEGTPTPTTKNAVQPMPTTPSDNDFKSLKIQ